MEGATNATRIEILRRIAASFWARALVSAGLLALVATQVDFHTVGSRLSGASWGWFATAVVLLLASFVVAALRWQLFLAAAGLKVPPAGAVRAYLIGAFANNFLPSQVGGDVVRAWIASRPGERVRAMTTVVIDRATALGCLLAVGWIAFAAHSGPVPGQIASATASATGVLGLSFWLGLVLVRSRRVRLRLPPRLRSHGRSARDAARTCFASGVLTKTVALGLVFEGLVALSAWLVAHSLDLALPFSTLVITLAPVHVLSVLPISIGGFGVREGSYVFLLSYAGVGATDATLFSLLSAAAGAVASLPGALALLRAPRARGRPAGADR